MHFSQLNLIPDLLKAIQESGYDQATPIQHKTIPLILEGRDVLGGAQTGTGKTAAFTLPMLQRLQNTDSKTHRKVIRALILTPTRELAHQVGECVSKYSRFLNLKHALVFGGVNIKPQISQLRQGIDIVVATPGRLLDHVTSRTIDLTHVEILIIDEADRMLDMGFIRDMRKIMDVIPRKRQTLMFSATFSHEIHSLANTFLKSPMKIQVSPENTAAERIKQVVFPVDKGRKRELLSHYIGSQNWRQVLVFTRTKHGASKLTRQLNQDGLKTAEIHSNKSQAARMQALKQFKDGTVRVLVATDIAARGIDILSLPYVVNFELPHVPEDYIHRIGRTARAGNEGMAVSLVSHEEQKELKRIERLLKRDLEKQIIPGYEMSLNHVYNGPRNGFQSQDSSHLAGKSFAMTENSRNRFKKKPSSNNFKFARPEAAR